MWKKLMELVDLDEPTSFLDPFFFGSTQRECKPNEDIVNQYREYVRTTNFCYRNKKLPGWEKPHAKNCRVVLRYGRARRKSA